MNMNASKSGIAIQLLCQVGSANQNENLIHLHAYETIKSGRSNHFLLSEKKIAKKSWEVDILILIHLLHLG